MGIAGSKPPTEILLLVQSCNKQSYIPYSTVKREPGLAENVDGILRDMGVANQAGLVSDVFDYSLSPGRWVFVDLGNASIINRKFLRELVLPGGCYMVLSKHFSALSKDELVGIRGRFNIPRQYISPQAAYTFPVYKFIFPAHELPFIVPHPAPRELDVGVQQLTEWLIAAIDYIAREISENHGNIRTSTLMVPSGGSWVVMRHGENSVIYKPFLGEMLVPSREYMVIPTHAVNMSTGDLSQAMGPASHRVPIYIPSTQSPSPYASASPYSTCTMTPTLNPLSSPSVSSCSTYTLTPRQSPDGDGSVLEEEEMVELKITRAEDCSIQYYRIPSSWTIGLAIVNLDVSQGARLVETVGLFRSFNQYSQESLAELGWSRQGGVMELYLVDDTVIKTEPGQIFD